jgi:membrane protease YdiL (CAAX protease family)
MLLGVVLLVRRWLWWDRVRGGLLPAPAVVVPTTPFPLPGAIGLFLLYALATVALLLALQGDPKDRPLVERLPAALAVQAGVGLAFAAVIELRRLRLSAPPPPRLPRALLVGAWTWAVSIAVVMPVALLWMVLLRGLGQGHGPQELVRLTVDPATPAWTVGLVAAYGVVVAPVVEETLFRGLLYPAIRSAAGGGRRGVWTGVLVTAALFAAVHQDVGALVPLFVLAIVLGFVFENTNSLAGVIVAHGLFNAGSLLPTILARTA